MIARWREPTRISSGRQGISRPLAGSLQVDAAEHGGEFGGGPLDPIRPRRGPAQGAALKPAHPDGGAVSVAIEHLDSIVTTIGKDEEMPRGGVLAEGVAGDLRQA